MTPDSISELVKRLRYHDVDDGCPYSLLAEAADALESLQADLDLTRRRLENSVIQHQNIKSCPDCGGEISTLTVMEVVEGLRARLAAAEKVVALGLAWKDAHWRDDRPRPGNATFDLLEGLAEWQKGRQA